MNLLFAPHDSREGGAIPLPARIVGGLCAFLLVALVFAYAFHSLQYHWGWESVYAYRQKFINGWLMTLAISAAALLMSLVIGLCTALAQRSHFLPLRYLSKLYIEGIRGTPLLVQILVFFYVVADAFGVGDRYAVGVITLSLFAGAYISEIIRAGIESVGESQLESGRAIGLTRPQIYRHVVFPQAFRQTLPPLAGQFASLIKDSSLLSIIAVSEFTLNAQEVNAFTYSTLESYLPLAAGYLVLTLPISLLSRRLEKKFRYET
uniref:Amino acid ABC transporter permease n=1 Tax=Geobacter metallireducens TaxID=28232 RepID=A0A831UCN9_GEOME